MIEPQQTDPADPHQPPSSLYDRPVPDGLVIDSEGLVDAWVMEAEDWLLAYAGIEELTPREAFEGIESLARLTRCREGIRQRDDVAAVLTQLQGILSGTDAVTFAEAALSFPDLDGWQQQAAEAWEAEDDSDDNEELTEQLLTDLDAAEALIWIAHDHLEEPDSHTDLQALVEGWKSIQQWLKGNGKRYRPLLLFSAAEGYIRAVGKTLADPPREDHNGWLSLSGWKYAELLDEVDWFWRDASATPSLDRLLRHGELQKSIDPPPPFEDSPVVTLSTRPSLREVWDVDILSATAAATKEASTLEGPTQRWIDPTGTFEASCGFPTYRQPNGDTRFEILFGQGHGFALPAIDMVGHSVSFGNATSEIRAETIASQAGDETKVFVELAWETVIADGDGDLVLKVDGEEWAWKR